MACHGFNLAVLPACIVHPNCTKHWHNNPRFLRLQNIPLEVGGPVEAARHHCPFKAEATTLARRSGVDPLTAGHSRPPKQNSMAVIVAEAILCWIAQQCFWQYEANHFLRPVWGTGLWPASPDQEDQHLHWQQQEDWWLQRTPTHDRGQGSDRLCPVQQWGNDRMEQQDPSWNSMQPRLLPTCKILWKTKGKLKKRRPLDV